MLIIPSDTDLTICKAELSIHIQGTSHKRTERCAAICPIHGVGTEGIVIQSVPSGKKQRNRCPLDLLWLLMQQSRPRICELVRLLRKTATPKKYERIFYQHKDKKKANKYNKHFIQIACGSQELVIYDKTYQMNENNLAVAYEGLPAGVLRIEVHYSRDKIKSIEKDAGTDDPLDLLWLLIQESKPRILKLVEKCYPQLDYLSYEDAKAQIKQSRFKAHTRKQMLTLLEEMRRRQTIDAALHGMARQGVPTEMLLGKFEKLGINPIPLRQGYASSRMPSLTKILRAVGKDPVCVQLFEPKYK